MLLLVASFIYPPLFRKIGLDRRRPAAKPGKGPQRPSAPPSGEIFSRELFEGEMGEFLRKSGYAPDDPRNQAVNVQPLEVLLAEDLAGLRRAEAAVNSVGDFRLTAWHLLPPSLWSTGFGPWLRQHLDLSPYRPWNTIFLPVDAKGAAALGLPIAPPQHDTISDELRATLEIVMEIYQERNPPEAETVQILMRAIRSNFPMLLPKDIGDFSDRVIEARANVRAMAFANVNNGLIDKAALIKSQATFLGKPEEQLVA